MHPPHRSRRACTVSCLLVLVLTLSAVVALWWGLYRHSLAVVRPLPVVTPVGEPCGAGAVPPQPTLVPWARLQAESTGPTMALGFSSNTVLRQAVRLAEGGLRLVEWDLASGQAVASSTAGPQHIVRAGFDTSANTLVMASAAPGDERLGTDGVWVWRLPGNTHVRQSESNLKPRDVALSGDGRWTVAAIGAALDLDPVEPALADRRYARLLFTETGVETPTVVTMDAIGEDYAYALEDGEVREEHRLGNGWHQLATSGERVLALQFDAARRYLGILRERGLTLAVLRIPGGLGDRRVTLDPMADGALAFDPTSDRLAIASDRGWEVRDTGRLRRLCGASLPGCTAIAFSPDGCQLAVGDAEGTVYVYRLGGD